MARFTRYCGWVGFWCFSPSHTAFCLSLPRIDSIAVLPLKTCQATRHKNTLDGMTDALIGEVARIGSLRVISRTSMMRYKGGARKSLPSIARELNVEAIVEGTVLQSGQRVRIKAQLIRARDDRHLWSEQYERDLTDSAATRSGTRHCRSDTDQADPGEKASLTRTHRVNPEAYEAYLKGNFFLHKGVPGIAKSIEFFRQTCSTRHKLRRMPVSRKPCATQESSDLTVRRNLPRGAVAALKGLELDHRTRALTTLLRASRRGMTGIWRTRERSTSAPFN